MTQMASHYWKCEDIHPVCLSVAPLSHAAGVVAFAMFPLGAANVVMTGFDALEVLRNIERFRVTHLFLPPTAFYALLAHPEVEKFDYSSLRVFLLAASPVSPDKLRKGVEIFGPCMCQCYGQTESPMLLTWLDQRTLAAAAPGDHPGRLASCGKATSAVRLAIMDGTGRLLPAKQTGEIVARGSLVTPGYYKMPEATAEIRAHGWHHTGDLGYYDEDGYFYIVDRLKDMIISGGFNVFSAEVEGAIMGLPEVYECAVIGVPDDRWGEAVKAIVVLRAGASLTETEVVAQCKAKLGVVKSPKSVAFRSEIAKTAAGKIDRKELGRPYWAGVERSVHGEKSARPDRRRRVSCGIEDHDSSIQSSAPEIGSGHLPGCNRCAVRIAGRRAYRAIAICAAAGSSGLDSVPAEFSGAGDDHAGNERGGRRAFDHGYPCRYAAGVAGDLAA